MCDSDILFCRCFLGFGFFSADPASQREDCALRSGTTAPSEHLQSPSIKLSEGKSQTPEVPATRGAPATALPKGLTGSATPGPQEEHSKLGRLAGSSLSLTSSSHSPAGSSHSLAGSSQSPVGPELYTGRGFSVEAASSPSQESPRSPTPEHFLVTLDSIFLKLFPLCTFPHLLRKQQKCSSVSVMTWVIKLRTRVERYRLFPIILPSTTLGLHRS